MLRFLLLAVSSVLLLSSPSAVSAASSTSLFHHSTSSTVSNRLHKLVHQLRVLRREFEDFEIRSLEGNRDEDENQNENQSENENESEGEGDSDDATLAASGLLGPSRSTELAYMEAMKATHQAIESGAPPQYVFTLRNRENLLRSEVNSGLFSSMGLPRSDTLDAEAHMELPPPAPRVLSYHFNSVVPIANSHVLKHLLPYHNAVVTGVPVNPYPTAIVNRA